LQLRRLLREYGGAIEADLHRYYGIRLTRALYGSPQERYTPRELLTRIRNLPRDSAFVAAVIGPELVEWSVEAYLLARAAYLLEGANWQRGGGKGPKPKPLKVPRPRRRKSNPADVTRRLRNLGLIPGGKPRPDRPVTQLEEQLAIALERAAAQRQPT
ncbi:MAG TPA: hypothetical protein VIL46_14020, partial [Gemmataceae bacterium]